MLSMMISAMAFVLGANAGEKISFEADVDAVLKRKSNAVKTLAPIQPTEEVQGLVDYPDHVVDTIPAMELNKSHTLFYQPWAGHTWQLQKGQIARRFGDGGFPNSEDWKANYDYTHIFAPPGFLARSGDIDRLSPAEKYDLLVDPNYQFKFTETNWEEGGKYFREKGSVEGWMGICHGTTAAGIMDRRPKGTVEAVSANGQHRIRFYPSDIKALSSVFWAYVRYNGKFAGIRCNLKREEMGQRRTTPECFDTNAASFHLALVNQIGLFKRPFVIDRSNTNEVWNHTVYSYSFDWVNPKSKTKEKDFNDALVSAADWRADPYRNYRSHQTKYIIGVRARATHRTSVAASTRRSSPTAEPSRTEEYRYDLELDENLRVVGGEWYQSDYPDFLWRVSLTEPALADSERNLTTPWDLSAPIPEDWRIAADGARGWDGKTRIPMGRIVQALIAASQSEGNSSSFQ